MSNLIEQAQAVVLHVNASAVIDAEALVQQVRARAVIDARAAVAAAKDALEAAEAAFAATADVVVLDDGTKVAVVRQQRRAIDSDSLQEAVSSQQWTRLSKRVFDAKLFDMAVAAGQLDPELVNSITTHTEVSFVRVTQPKR